MHGRIFPRWTVAAVRAIRGRRTTASRATTAAPALAALALIGACASSPPSRFYTLSNTAPEATPPAGVGSVIITRVTIPGEIDRPEIVRRTGPNQLSIAELDRWAAPLDETIRRVLADDIDGRVPTPVPGQQIAVSVDIHEFYGDGACNVTLRAVWTPRQPAGQPGSEDIQVPSSGSCPVTLAATMSIALGRLSDRIIASAARLSPAAK